MDEGTGQGKKELNATRKAELQALTDLLDLFLPLDSEKEVIGDVRLSIDELSNAFMNVISTRQNYATYVSKRLPQLLENLRDLTPDEARLIFGPNDVLRLISGLIAESNENRWRDSVLFRIVMVLLLALLRDAKDTEAFREQMREFVPALKRFHEVLTEAQRETSGAEKVGAISEEIWSRLKKRGIL